jgi:TldD protein
MEPVHREVLAYFSAVGADEGLIRRALAEATTHGADDADLFFEASEATSIGMSDRKVNRAHTSTDLGVGVRVVVGDQTGYAYTEDLSPESVARAARTAAEIARGAITHAPVATGPARSGDFYPLKRRWSDVAIDERIPLLRRWEEQAFATDSRVEKVQLQFSDSETRVMICRADGRIATDFRPMTSAFLSATLFDGTKRENGSHNVAARADLSYFDEARQQRLVKLAIERANLALEAGEAPSGEMMVVMNAGSSGILLHEAIGHGLEADFNRKGVSIFANRIGERIAEDHVTIVDDATLPGARGALNIDDEGSETEKTVLVENGILKSYLHDRISARHYGVKPTGSGRRESFRHPVLPRMRCTYMEPGPHAREEIIRSVKRGILCDTFANGQVQIGAGDFSFYVRLGWMIEDGVVTRPVKDVNLIGNGPKVLGTIDMVGDDLVVDEGGWTCGKDGQGVPVSQGMPTVRVRNLSVGGR